MSDIEPINHDKLAAFLHNQKRKLQIIEEDNNIQKAGLEDDENHWRYVQSYCREQGNTTGLAAIDKELQNIQMQKEQISEQESHFNSLGTVLNELTALPDIDRRIKRIMDAQQGIIEESRRIDE